jgi:membrane associated rhomboid family serine protease
MILPLTHERMTVQRLPWVTISILALNFVVFLATWPIALRDYARSEAAYDELEIYAAQHPEVLEENCERCPANAEFQVRLGKLEEIQGQHIFSRFGYVPARPSLPGLFGSLFLHAGWMHLLGNMYLLWLCGCSIEDLWGRPIYAVVYLVGGAGAALAHASFQPDSTAHLVGASGAIAALMGIFCVRCWNTNIRFFYWFFLTLFGTFTAPAWIMLILWLTRELFYAFVFAGSSTVAFWAHVGGFCFGVVIAFGMKLTRLEERVIAPAIDRKTNLVAKTPRFQSALDHFDRGDYQRAVSELTLAIQESRDDPDLYHLLARSYQELGRPVDAARFLRQELAIHVRKRELELVAQTYEEIRQVQPDFEFTGKELLSAASALMATGLEGEAVDLYKKLLATAAEPLLRLRAGMALAEFHEKEGRNRQGLSLLEEIAPLAQAHPEWQSILEAKRQAFLSAR